MHSFRPSLLFVAAILYSMSNMAYADKVFAHSKSLNMYFTAMGTPWCQSNVNIQITANDINKFDTTKFYSILKKLSHVLVQECTEVNTISLQSQKTNGYSIWRGSARKSDGWQIHKTGTRKLKSDEMILNKTKKEIANINNKTQENNTNIAVASPAAVEKADKQVSKKANETGVSEAKKIASRELYDNLFRTANEKVQKAYLKVREAAQNVCKQSREKCKKICLENPAQCPDEHIKYFYPDGLAIHEYCKDKADSSCIRDGKNRGILRTSPDEEIKNKYQKISTVTVSAATPSAVIVKNNRPVSKKSMDQLAGGWKGELFGKPIELVAWPHMIKSDLEWSLYFGYMYSPYYNCFMVLHLNYKNDDTLASFTSLGFENRKGNCAQNILKGSGFKGFKGEAEFVLSPNKQELDFEINFLHFNDFKLKAPKKIKLLLKRRPASSKMITFLKTHKNDNIKKPSSSVFAFLKSGDIPETALKQSKQLKKTGLYKTTSKKPPLPSSMDNFYVIDENGGIAVWQYNKNNTLNSYAELLSQFDYDLGTEINQYFGWRKYDSSKGLIYNQPIQTKVTGKLRNYCRSLKSEPFYTWLKPYQLPDGKYVSNIWRIIPDNSKGVCIIGSYTSEGCKMTKCQKYNYSKALATSSKKIAYTLARKKQQQKEGLSYSELKRQADRINANSSNSYTPMKSYEEPGGLCGAVSCMQQDSDFALDWIEW